MNKSRLHTLILLMMAFCFVGTAQAQTSLLVDVVQVQLWPEYDRPSMLVIYTVELSADQTLPAPVTVRIPSSVGEPTAVAVLENTTLVTREYTRTVDGEWAEISLDADFPVVQIEFYDFSLSQQDQPRDYDFRWVADYNVGNLVVSVRQPVNANGMTIQPSLGGEFVDSNGLTNYSSSFGPWTAGQTFELSLSYNKNDNTLVTENLQQGVPQSQSPSIASIGDQLPWWAWVLIFLGVFVLAAGAVIFIRNNRFDTKSSSYRRKKKRGGSRGGSRGRPGKKADVFCHQCGTQALAKDQFCRVCGTKLRL